MSLQVWLPLINDSHNQGLLPNVSIAEYGATIDNNGKIGKCYSFDGEDDYLQLNNIGSALSGLSQMSFGFWCYSTEGNLSKIFCIRSSSNHQINFGTENLNFRDSKHSSLEPIAITQPSPNTWTHYMFVYNNGSWIIYKDGIKDVEKGYPTAKLNNWSEFRISRNTTSSGSTYFSGKINDFRIYDHALTAKEVEEISKGLVLWYQLNSTNITYSNIYDSSGYRNNGTIVGSLTTSTGSPRYHVATNFSDFTNYITTPSLGLTECSYSMWVRPSADATVSIIFTDYLSGICFGRGTSYVYCHHDSLNPNNRYVRSTIANNNTWQHFVVCRTITGKISLYKNGELVSPNSTSASGFNHYSTDQLLIGRRIDQNQSDNNAYSIKGDIVDFREYATILTPAQVKELYFTSMIVNADGTTSPRELVS